MTARQRVRIGLLGAGFLARTRVRCYRRVAGAELVAVAAGRAASAERFASRFDLPVACASADDLLATDVDLVDLCVPNHLHRPLAEAAAKAGKHVVCTKPLAAYVGQDLVETATDAEIARRDRRAMLAVATRDAEAMVAAAKQASVQLMYGENWVYAPAIARARGLLAAADATVLEMHGHEAHHGSHAEYARRWRTAGGGALLRLAAHPLGAMVELLRSEGERRGQPVVPVAVTANVTDLARVPAPNGSMRIVTGEQDVEGWGCAIVEWSSGARGVAHGSDALLGGMDSRLSVQASNCRLECNLSPNDMLAAYAPDGAVLDGEYLQEKLETTAGWSTPMPDEDWSSGHLAMGEDFVRAVQEDRPARADGELGVWVTKLIYAAYVSAAEGRRVELA